MYKLAYKDPRKYSDSYGMVIFTRHS